MRRIHDLIAAHPSGRTALVLEDGRRIGFGALRAAGRQLASQLRAHGIRPGDRLMLVAENGYLYAAAIMAASRLDAWLILVNARQSAEEIAAIDAHAGVRAILLSVADSAPAQAHAARLGATEIAQGRAGPVVATASRDVLPEPVDEGQDQVAALLYTTGTTSTPKGVMLTHDNIIFNATNAGATTRVGPGDEILCVLPGTHVYCFASAFLPALTHGARARLIARFEPGAVMDALAGGVTRFPGVPQMFTAVLAHAAATGRRLDIPRLKAIAAGGAPLDPAVKERVEAAFGLPLNNGYGLTETSPSVAATRTEAPRSDLAVGLPYDGVEVVIDRPAADGIGEILIRGRNVMKGYYRDPVRSAEVLRPDGFFCSGDLGRIGPDGALYVVGRLKELIIRGGFNIHPPEIEAMLTRHPDVLQAAVVGRKAAGDEEILAFVTARGGLSEEALRAFLKERLAGYKVPQRIVIADALPSASTGKVLKHKLISHFSEILG